MAKVHPNSLFGHISGTIGGNVFRRHGDRTVLQRRPVFRQRWSRAQETTRATFGGGSVYAATVKANPELRQRYALAGRRRRRGRLNYRQMAIRDYFNPPTLGNLTLGAFHPATGGELSILAHDDFEVARVMMVLRAADGSVLTFGDATPQFGAWRFTVAAPAAGARTAASVTITAFDHPGNFAVGTFELR